MSTVIGKPRASPRRVRVQGGGTNLDSRPTDTFKPSNGGLPVDAGNVTSAAAKRLVPARQAARPFAVELDAVRRQ
jgi:hypothetical protein